MTGTASFYVSGIIQQIYDNSTIAVKEYLHRFTLPEYELNVLSQCLTNYLQEKFDFIATNMQKIEAPVSQITENYGIGNAVVYVADAIKSKVGDAVRFVVNEAGSKVRDLVRYVVGDTVARAVESAVEYGLEVIKTHKRECLFAFLACMALSKLMLKYMNKRQNAQPQTNNITVMQANNALVIQANNPLVIQTINPVVMQALHAFVQANNAHVMQANNAPVITDEKSRRPRVN